MTENNIEKSIKDKVDKEKVINNNVTVTYENDKKRKLKIPNLNLDKNTEENSNKKLKLKIPTSSINKVAIKNSNNIYDKENNNDNNKTNNVSNNVPQKIILTLDKNKQNSNSGSVITLARENNKNISKDNIVKKNAMDLVHNLDNSNLTIELNDKEIHADNINKVIIKTFKDTINEKKQLSGKNNNENIEKLIIEQNKDDKNEKENSDQGLEEQMGINKESEKFDNKFIGTEDKRENLSKEQITMNNLQDSIKSFSSGIQEEESKVQDNVDDKLKILTIKDNIPKDQVKENSMQDHVNSKLLEVKNEEGNIKYISNVNLLEKNICPFEVTKNIEQDVSVESKNVQNIDKKVIFEKNESFKLIESSDRNINNDESNNKLKLSKKSNVVTNIEVNDRIELDKKKDASSNSSDNNKLNLDKNNDISLSNEEIKMENDSNIGLLKMDEISNLKDIKLDCSRNGIPEGKSMITIDDSKKNEISNEGIDVKETERSKLVKNLTLGIDFKGKNKLLSDEKVNNEINIKVNEVPFKLVNLKKESTMKHAVNNSVINSFTKATDLNISNTFSSDKEQTKETNTKNVSVSPLIEKFNERANNQTSFIDSQEKDRVKENKLNFSLAQENINSFLKNRNYFHFKLPSKSKYNEIDKSKLNKLSSEHELNKNNESKINRSKSENNILSQNNEDEDTLIEDEVTVDPEILPQSNNLVNLSIRYNDEVLSVTIPFNISFEVFIMEIMNQFSISLKESRRYTIIYPKIIFSETSVYHSSIYHKKSNNDETKYNQKENILNDNKNINLKINSNEPSQNSNNVNKTLYSKDSININLLKKDINDIISLKDTNTGSIGQIDSANQTKGELHINNQKGTSKISRTGINDHKNSSEDIDYLNISQVYDEPTFRQMLSEICVYNWFNQDTLIVELINDVYISEEFISVNNIVIPYFNSSDHISFSRINDNNVNVDCSSISGVSSYNSSPIRNSNSYYNYYSSFSPMMENIHNNNEKIDIDSVSGLAKKRKLQNMPQESYIPQEL